MSDDEEIADIKLGNGFAAAGVLIAAAGIAHALARFLGGSDEGSMWFGVALLAMGSGWVLLGRILHELEKRR